MRLGTMIKVVEMKEGKPPTDRPILFSLSRWVFFLLHFLPSYLQVTFLFLILSHFFVPYHNLVRSLTR